MRVMMGSQVATGHLYPLMPLATALRDAGHEVIFAVGGEPVSLLTELGYPTYTGGESIGWAVPQILARSPELSTSMPRAEAWRLDAELFADVLPRAGVTPMRTLLTERQPDLVIFESTFLAGSLAAAELGIPAVCFSLWGTGHWHLHESELRDRVDQIWVERNGEAPVEGLLTGRTLLDPAPPSLATGTAPGDRMPIRSVPWGDPRLVPLDLPREPRSRPLILVTLGTVGWGTVDVLRAVAGALASMPADVILVLGHHFDAGTLAELPTSIRVETFVRQDLLLPKLDLAIHHGGSGTMLGAAAYGVPQLIMPFGADQFQNGDALLASGSGLVLESGALARDGLVQAISTLLEDPAYRTSASGLAAEIAAMPAPQELVTDLVAYS